MRIALVGNQNSGKTTLFNLLTGSRQKVGNWPGVTMEKKTGIIKDTTYELVDLPGIYSLSPYTLEEEVSRNYIFKDEIDLIINIVDATSIERSLYLTTQLLELDTPVIIALNMTDIMEKKGVKIDISKFSEVLGINTIVKISALKGNGIDDLVNVIKPGKIEKRVNKRIYSDNIEKEITAIEEKINIEHKRFVAVKLLEKDILFNDLSSPFVTSSIEYLEKRFDVTLEEVIATQRYNYIERVKELSINEEMRKTSATDKIDRVLVNKYLGIPIFIIIMFLVYFLSVGLVGSWTVELIESWFGSLGDATGAWLEGVGASDWSISLVVNGIIAGVGAVLNFVPQLIILFLLIALLEASGYMSRISFLLDKIFRKFGLSGKALIPFIVGSGCSVPGVMSVRTIEDSEEREMMITLTPFFPCSAKLPIISLFAGYFFEKSYGLVTFSLYLLAIVVIVLSAIILRKFKYKSNSTSYISELPEYKIPNPKYIFRDVFDKTFGFVKRAGTIILLSSIIIWVLLSFNFRFEYGIPIDESILAQVGSVFSWVFYPILGEFSWGATVAAIQGLVAKEQVISTMSVIAGVAGENIGASLIFNSSGIFGFFTPASAYAFMAFNLFSAPCFGTMGAMRKEFGSTKKTLKAVVFQTFLAWCLAILIHLIGLLMGVIL